MCVIEVSLRPLLSESVKSPPSPRNSLRSVVPDRKLAMLITRIAKGEPSDSSFGQPPVH
jgi:hypothetical protein